MIIKKLVVGELEANCYILADEKTKQAVVIDPGAEGERILEIIKRDSLKVLYIVNTHAHIDHIGANDILGRKTGAFLLIHAADAHLLKDAELNLSTMLEEKSEFLPPAKLLNEGDEIKVNNFSLQILHTPGHTPGSICLYTEGKVFTGDTLFAGAVGRTDLPGGSLEELKRSIQKKLLILPDEVMVYPGHGPDTTIGKEKRSNPFINELCIKE
ncbi:MAG: MBL fold metallo-hydrolase [Candidatus Aerophobetes bacterium]|nr:MBL fold metallo-hydrolase [Candidatus Aerophobetes bacterium]